MQKRVDPSHEAGGQLGIRTSLWPTLCGVLVACVFLISISRRYGPQPPNLQAQPRAVESLERNAAADEPFELAQAKAQFESLIRRLGDVQTQ